MLTSWRINILGKAPIGTFVEEGNKLYIKERGNTPHKGEWYRPWKCVKVDGKWIDDGGYVSSVELGFCKGKILKLRMSRDHFFIIDKNYLGDEK